MRIHEAVRVPLEGLYLLDQLTDSAGIAGTDKKVDGLGAETREIRHQLRQEHELRQKHGLVGVVGEWRWRTERRY